MKFRILILALLIICLLSANAFASEDATCLYDSADVISAEEEVTLNRGLAPVGSRLLSGKHILLAVVIGMVLSFLIPMTMLKNQLKSVRIQPEANSYIQQNTLRFRRQSDTFLYRNVTRIPKPKNNTQHGGGRSGKF